MCCGHSGPLKYPMQNVYSNLYSQAVTHPSTNRSQPCLTSVIGRELVYSRWYGRRHQSRGKILMQKSKNAGQKHVTLGLKLILNLFDAHVEKSRHAGRGGGQGGAADDCSSNVAAGCRRMALTTVAWASLKIFHFLTSAIFSGTKCSWMSIIGGH